MNTHTLRQFLEGILEFEGNVVRVGSRSQSEALRACNLREKVREASDPKFGGQHAKARWLIIDRQRELERRVGELCKDLNRPCLALDELRELDGVMSAAHAESFDRRPCADALRE